MVVLIKDNFTTVKHAFGGSGRLKLNSGLDEVAVAGDVYKFVVNDGNLSQV